MKNQSKYYRRNFMSIFLGGLGSQAMYVLMSNYSSIFFTDFLGISAAAAGLIFLLSRIWDAANDMICGVWIERSNPRLGKVQTFMAAGGVITAIGLVMLFTVPGLPLTGRVAWGAVSYNIVGMAFTAVTVATLLQMARGTDNSDERVSLTMSYTVSCSIAGIIMAALITSSMSIFGKTDMAKGYQMAAVISSVLGLVFLAGSVVLFKDRASELSIQAGKEEDKPEVLDMLKAVLKVPSFLIVVFASCITNLGYGVMASGMMYYLTYDLKKPELMALMLPAMYIGLFAGSIVAPRFVRFGKKQMLYVALLLMLISVVPRLIFGDIGILPYLGYAITAAGSSFLLTYLNPTLVDCADYAEYKTGVHCQALALTGFTFVNKMTMGLASAILGFALQIGGYDGTAAMQTQKAVDMIHNVYFWPTIIACVIGAILLAFYKLDEKTMEEVRKALEIRRGGKENEVSEM